MTTNCKRLHVRIDSIRVTKSESYGVFGEPGASAEWRMNFTVQDQSRLWSKDGVRDNTDYQIGYDFFVDLSPSQTVSIRASGFEEDDTSANDVLPPAEATQKPADNWDIGATYNVSSQSNEDFQYTVFYSLKCAENGEENVDSASQALVNSSPRRYVGIFRAGNDAHGFWVGDWNSFEAKWEEWSKAGLRLIDLDTYVEGNQRLYAGVFRAGTDAHALWVGVEWENFKTKWEEFSNKGLRLIDLETYFEDGKRLYAGVFRAGTDAHALWAGVEWENFNAKWQEFSNKGLRLIDLSSYSEGGKRLFNGVFRAGTDAHALWIGDWNSFTSKWKELSKGGLRLIDIDSYVEGNKRLYVGVFRAGSDGHALWEGDWNSFITKWKELSKGGLRLIDIATYPPSV